MATILEIKERLLQFGVDSPDDAFLMFLKAKSEERIKAATNLSEVPEALRYELIDEVAGAYVTDQMAVGKIDVERVVKSISEGDTSVTFEAGTDPVSMLKSYLAKMAIPETMFARYRVFTW